MKKMIITSVAVAGLIVGGATFVGASDDASEAEVKTDSQVIEMENNRETKEMLSVEKVKEIALSKYDGHIEHIELDHDDGLTYYEVEIEDGDAEYELAVEAFTGEIDDDEFMRNSLDEVISFEAAEKIAVEHFGGNLIDIELDEDDGHYEYEMELMTERGEVELTIDAVTGEIIESELDD